MYLRTPERPRGRSVAAIVCLLLASLGGCVGAPVQEMSDARQAITAAVSAGAGEHAPEKLEAAQRLLGSAEEKLYRRAYTGAKHDALQARSLAIEALRESDPGREPIEEPEQ